MHDWHKKSLKIPKGQSESVYRRRADNTMAKRKGTKGQEKFKDTRSRKSEKDIQYNGQKKQGKRTNYDLQNTTQKTK